jgi:hypothetical protein
VRTRTERKENNAERRNEIKKVLAPGYEEIFVAGPSVELGKTRLGGLSDVPALPGKPDCRKAHGKEEQHRAGFRRLKYPYHSLAGC